MDNLAIGVGGIDAEVVATKWLRRSDQSRDKVMTARLSDKGTGELNDATSLGKLTPLHRVTSVPFLAV